MPRGRDSGGKGGEIVYKWVQTVSLGVKTMYTGLETRDSGEAMGVELVSLGVKTAVKVTVLVVLRPFTEGKGF